MTGPQSSANEIRAGLLMGASCYIFWGFATIYWRWLGHAPTLAVIGHRALWSLLFALGYVAVRGRLSEVRSALADPKALALLACSSALIFLNWLVFVWAVTSGRLLEVSFGYFVNPIMSVAIGMLLLGERLNLAQSTALGLALLAIAIQAIGLGAFPWVALYLAATFAGYGYVRKIAQVRPTPGFVVESLMHLPFAAAIVGWFEIDGSGPFASDAATALLLIGAGPVTALPLMVFAAAARRLQLITVGVLQYFVPSIQFGLAVGVYGEHMSPLRLATFVVIWIGLAVFTADAVWRDVAARRATAAPCA